MWSSTLILSLVLAARLGVAEQLAFPVDVPARQSDNYNQKSQYSGAASIKFEHEPSQTTFAETLVSALSASTQHTTFLHLLQRAKCIPLLAHIGNATVFAPTDAAWDDWAERNQPLSLTTSLAKEGASLTYGWLGPGGLGDSLEDEEAVLRARVDGGADEAAERALMDNQNWALRQHLLYHFLNYTLSPSSLIADKSSQNISTLTTLLFPLAEQPVLPPTPEPGAPWLPQGGEGMLGGHGQRVRLALAGSDEGGERGRIGVDWLGEGGVEVWDGSGWVREGNDTLTTSSKDKKDKKDRKDRKGKKGEKTDPVQGVRWVRNGAVVGVDGVLDMPRSIEEIIETHPSLSHLAHLLPFDSLPTPLPNSLATTPHLTLFAPSNEAFSVLDDIEKHYLESSYGEEGVGRIVGNNLVLAVGRGRVGWSDEFGRKGSRLNNTSGTELSVRGTASGGLDINGTEATAVDIFASNGVLHIVPSLILPEGFALLNSAEKTLLSLNATRFVSLLRSADLSDKYIGEHGKDDEPYTILAPTDDVIESLERQGPFGAPPLLESSSGATVLAGDYSADGTVINALPRKDSSPLAALLQYHILPGRLLPSEIKDGMLLGTELRTSALKGGRQRLLVDVSERPGRDRNDWETIGEGEIRFGGATVLAKPVKSGNSIIYLVSNLLSPPDDVLQTAVSDLQLSTFIAAVYAAGLDKVVKHTPATTYFMPRNRAFSQLGLTMKYLLLPEGKDELRKVVKYHIINGVVYTPDVEVGKHKYTTLEGGQVILNRTMGENGTLSLRSPRKWEGHDSGTSLPANGELRPAKIIHTDALTETGVIHTLDAVILPADVKITNAKLIRGSKQSTMMDLMARAGLGWILEGREPSDEEVQRAQLDGVVRANSNDQDPNEGGGDGDKDREADDLAWPSYTVLVPTDKAFSQLNLTYYLSDKEALLNLLRLHIIPSADQPGQTGEVASRLSAQSQNQEGPRDSQPLLMGDDAIYATLLSPSSKYGDVAFRATGDNSYIVGIRNARGGGVNAGDAARVGQTGRASVRWRRASKSGSTMLEKGKGWGGDADDEGRLWSGGMALGGGVILLDSVLVPYEPSWLSRWGWLVLTLSGIGLLLLITAISLGWWWMTRDKKGYEPIEEEDGTLEGEDDE